MKIDNKIKAVLILVFFAILVYSNSLGGEFVYDDDYFVVKNIHIRNLENIPLFFTNPSAVAFAELSQDVYRPITTISYALDYHISKLDTFIYHLENVLFHAANSVLLFFLLFMLFNDIFLAFFSSLLFVVHPVQTEVVSWISGRSSVLFLFFYLAAFIGYAAYIKKDKILYLVLSLAAYIISVFSKEMALSLPLLLIAYDIHFNNDDPWKKRIVRYAPYFFIAVFFVFIRFLIISRVSQCEALAGTPYNTFLTMMVVLVDYVKILIAPINLCAFYVTKVYQSFADFRALFSAAFLILLLISLPFIYKKSKRVSFAICLFLITLLPVSNIVPLRAFMAERFLYLPSIGYYILISIFFEKLARLKIKFKFITAKRITVLIAVILILLLSVRTMARNEDWKSALTITKSILKIDPLNPWGLLSLGVAYASEDNYIMAIKPLEKSNALAYNYFAPKNVLGFCYLQLGRLDDAIKILNEALKLKPDNLEALNSIGVAYAQSHKYEEAIRCFQRAAKIDPSFVNLYINLGTCYESMGQYIKAIEEYRKVEDNTRAKEQLAISYVRIGDVYVKLKLPEKAKEYYQKAIDISDSNMEDLKKVITDRLKIVL